MRQSSYFKSVTSCFCSLSASCPPAMAGTEGGDSKQLEEVLLAEEGEEVGEGGDVDKGPPKVRQNHVLEELSIYLCLRCKVMVSAGLLCYISKPLPGVRALRSVCVCGGGLSPSRSPTCNVQE